MKFRLFTHRSDNQCAWFRMITLPCGRITSGGLTFLAPDNVDQAIDSWPHMPDPGFCAAFLYFNFRWNRLPVSGIALIA
jgi:hypothetical protein